MGRVHHVDYFFNRRPWGYVTVTTRLLGHFFPCYNISSFLPLWKYFVVDATIKFSYLDFLHLLWQSFTFTITKHCDKNDIHHLLSVQIALRILELKVIRRKNTSYKCLLPASGWVHTYIHTYIHTHIRTYHFVGPQMLSYNSRTWNLSEKIRITQNKTTWCNTINSVKITVPKVNIVHKLIIKQYNTNYKQMIYKVIYLY